jgi:hypothetical protein
MPAGPRDGALAIDQAGEVSGIDGREAADA